MKKNSKRIKLIFAKQNVQIKFIFFFKSGTSIRNLILSNKKLIGKHIKLNNKIKFGVFGEIKEPSYIIKKGDRIEIYRELIFCPIIRRKSIVKYKNTNKLQLF